MALEFVMPKNNSNIIKVLGIGGGGGNAVNHMYRQGIKGVDFIICNTDAQALEMSPIPNKVQLGTSLTEGMGAGAAPEVGKNAAIETVDQIRDLLGGNTKMVFITAGMGGGTGTGASPIIAQVAREMGILTVAIVTTPFTFEGPRRKTQADEGLAELKANVDAIIVISNDKLRDMFGNLPMRSAFAEADNVLTTAAKGIAELITVGGIVNVDFKDVKTVMEDSGVALMGYATAEGDNRAIRAVEEAMASPLLDNNQITGARYILLNITSGKNEILMDEVSDITDFVQAQAGMKADVLWGMRQDDSLGEKVSVTIVATGFHTDHKNNAASAPRTQATPKKETRTVISLNAEEPQAVAAVTEQIGEPALEPNEPYLKTDSSPKQVSMFDFIPAATPVEPVLKKAEVIAPAPIAREEEVINAPVASVATPAVEEDDFDSQLRRSKERILRLKDLSMKLRTPNGINDLEAEPAYKRRNTNLDEVPHSSAVQASRFTLSEEDGKAEIRPNSNSFLHDNVD